MAGAPAVDPGEAERGEWGHGSARRDRHRGPGGGCGDGERQRRLPQPGHHLSRPGAGGGPPAGARSRRPGEGRGMSELLAAIAESDRDGLEGMLAENVVFHSPVQTYRGRPQVVRLLVTIGGVVDDVEVTRTLDGVTFFTATVEEHPVDGVLV